MADLKIHIKKKADGAAALSCTRADGSVTWHRHDGLQGAFYPGHDITHFAVETVTERAHSFYGLIAEGWDLGDFGKPWPRGPLPPESICSELIVGFLDRERSDGGTWSAVELNESIAAYNRQHGLDGGCVVTEEELNRIRECRDALLAQWEAVPAGDVLELEFDRASFGR